MIKKIIVLYTQEIGETIHTQKQRKNADKKTMYIISSQAKTTAKTRKNAIKKRYFFIIL